MESSNQASAVYYRLIALWVLCEAMLGGIIHGFRIPVSGLLVGGSAVICICLIAWYVPVKHAIIKATIIVAVFKMILSPQAPIPAYFAVFFQGILGEVLFFNKRAYKISCMALAVLALLESGLQRILVLTIIYGNDLWVAINSFLNGLTNRVNETNYSFILGASYVAIHAIAGIFIGIWAARLPTNINRWVKTNTLYSTPVIPETIELTGFQKRQRVKLFLFIIWMLLIGLYIQSYFKIGKPLLPAYISLKIFLRSLIIVFGWIILVNPILKIILHRWLQKKQSASSQEISRVLEIIPSVNKILLNSWQKAKQKRGIGRIILFSKTALVNIVSETSLEAETGSLPQIFILTGPVHSGKTTALKKWCEKRNVCGILSPLIDGKRVFMNIMTKEIFPMEAGADEIEKLLIGKYQFSKKNFRKASRILEDLANNRDWLVIDEIGPLELKGEGFHDVLKKILKSYRGKLLLVVRNSLAVEATHYYGIENYAVINVSELEDLP